MSVQYYAKVDWDPELIDVEMTDTDTAPVALQGLVETAVKINAGAPTNTPNKFIPFAIVHAADGNYENSGTTLSPNFTLMGGGSGGITQLTSDVLAGPGSGSQAATLAEAVKIYTAKIPLSSSDLLALNGTPVVAVPAVTGKTITPIAATMAYTFGTVAYTTNTTLQLIHNGSSNPVMASDFGQAASTFTYFANAAVQNPAAGNYFINNADLNIFVPAGNPAAGDGTMEIEIKYLIQNPL